MRSTETAARFMAAVCHRNFGRSGVRFCPPSLVAALPRERREVGQHPAGSGALTGQGGGAVEARGPPPPASTSQSGPPPVGVDCGRSRSSGRPRQCLHDRVEAGDGRGREFGEAAMLQVTDGLEDRVGGRAARRGELDEHGTAIARAGAAGDVAPALEPVRSRSTSSVARRCRVAWPTDGRPARPPRLFTRGGNELILSL